MFNQFNQGNQFMGVQNPVNQFGQPMVQGAIGVNGAPMKLNATNPLGANRINEMLKNGKGAPDIQITQADYDKAICTHRDVNGNSRVIDMGNGKVRCEICGAEFALTDSATIEDIKTATENIHNVLNTAKVMWLDVPDQVAINTFQILAVVDKIPQLYEIATSRLQKYQNVNPMMQNQYPVNGFNMLGQMVGPTGFGAPVMGMNYGQPMMQQPQGGFDQYGNPINTAAMQTGFYNPAQQFAMNPTAMATVGAGLGNTQAQQQMTGYVTNPVSLPGVAVSGNVNMNMPQQMQQQGQMQMQQQQQQQTQSASTDNKSDVSVSAQMHP